MFVRWRGTPYAVSHMIHILISNAFPCLVNVPLDFLCQVNTVFFGKCFTFNRHRRSSSSGLIARIQMKKDKHFKVCWIYILRFIRISRVVVTLMVFISWILFSGVLSYGFQASRNYIWQEISKLQWVESDCSSRSSLWCCCIRTIRSFSRRRRFLHAVQTDWKPRRFQWNQQGSLQVALYTSYVRPNAIISDYSEEDFYACFEQKCAEEFANWENARFHGIIKPTYQSVGICLYQ